MIAPEPPSVDNSAAQGSSLTFVPHWHERLLQYPPCHSCSHKFIYSFFEDLENPETIVFDFYSKLFENPYGLLLLDVNGCNPKLYGNSYTTFSDFTEGIDYFINNLYPHTIPTSLRCWTPLEPTPASYQVVFYDYTAFTDDNPVPFC